jgi:Ca-activated chloride channel family protein
VDFYFLVDRSGSMKGQKWNKAVEALQSCMKVLGAADRAMVTFFESSFQDFAERPLPPQQLLEDKQFQALKRLPALVQNAHSTLDRGG